MATTSCHPLRSTFHPPLSPDRCSSSHQGSIAWIPGQEGRQMDTIFLAHKACLDFVPNQRSVLPESLRLARHHRGKRRFRLASSSTLLPVSGDRFRFSTCSPHGRCDASGELILNAHVGGHASQKRYPQTLSTKGAHPYWLSSFGTSYAVYESGHGQILPIDLWILLYPSGLARFEKSECDVDYDVKLNEND